jgi:hypothetical protein
VNNTNRYNILYQGKGGRATIVQCIFVANVNRFMLPSGIGSGYSTLIDCVFDHSFFVHRDATILSSENVAYNTTNHTNTLRHLNTGLCPGFRTRTAVFTVSAVINSSFRFGSTLSPDRAHLRHAVYRVVRRREKIGIRR